MSKFSDLSEAELFQVEGGATLASRVNSAIQFAYDITAGVIQAVFTSLLSYIGGFGKAR